MKEMKRSSKTSNSYEREWSDLSGDWELIRKNRDASKLPSGSLWAIFRGNLRLEPPRTESRTKS